MPKTTVTIAALAMLVSGAAWANDKPLAPTYFVTDMIGRYAAPGRCGSPDVEDYLIISEVGVQIGDVLCEGVGKQTWEDGRMRVPLYTCRVDQEHFEDRTLSLERLTGGDLSVRSTARPSRVANEVMQRCGP